MHQRRAAAAIAGGVDDLLDAAGCGEVGETDVHRPSAIGHDAIGAAAAGIGVAVVALKGVRHALHPARASSTHPIGIAALAAIQEILTAATLDRVRQSGTLDRVIAIGGIDDEVAADQADS